MEDWLIDDDRLSLERKSLLPGEGFFYPDEFEEAKREQETQEALDGADVAVVADPDADGLAATALIREAHGEAALVPAGPHDLDDALERVAAYCEPGTTVFVCDLCPDAFEPISAELAVLAEECESVSWFDHHQWDGAVADAVRDAGVRLVVGESDEECTADVVARSLDYDFPEYLVELAEVTRDHDLWLREDPRSDDLADYAYWVEPEEYMEVVQAHGAAFPPEVEAFVAEQRVEKDALIDRAAERGELKDIGDWTVGVTYGRCSQNEVAEAMREEGADASVVVKPAGSASIRGTDAFERCHEVAQQVNGGGHPKAAGCKPDIYDDMLDYAHHWTTQGAVAKQVILNAFRNLVDDEDGEASDTAESAESADDSADESGESGESDE